jgi:hypothetical protein
VWTKNEENRIKKKSEMEKKGKPCAYLFRVVWVSYHQVL